MPKAPREDRVIQTLKELGFTVSEGKAYVALLKNHPATGYEVSAQSGVPRSAIYNVLRRLESLGLVNSVHAKPARYVPLEPERLTDLLKMRFSSTVENLNTSLTELSTRTAPSTTWTVQGYRSTLDQARNIIDASRASVYASIWEREALALKDALGRAMDRDVEVVLFSFTRLQDCLGRILSYNISQEELARYWRHKIILIGDHKEAIIGGADDVPENRAVMTTEASLIEIAISNLVLDVTLYGERTGQDVHDIVTGLSMHLAPIDDLINASADG